MWLRTSTWGKTRAMSCRVLSNLLSLTAVTTAATPRLPHAGNSSRPFPTFARRPGPRAVAPFFCQLGPSTPLSRGFYGSSMNSSSGAGDGVSYLSQKEAAEIDEILMGPLGFSVDQLMELAGLSVASAISEVPPKIKVFIPDPEVDSTKLLGHGFLVQPSGQPGGPCNFIMTPYTYGSRGDRRS